MESLQESIQYLHQALEQIPDPEAKSQIAAALNTLTTVQAKTMRPYAGPGRAGDQ